MMGECEYDHDFLREILADVNRQMKMKLPDGVFICHECACGQMLRGSGGEQ
jgi:hypothetical protein